MTRRATLALAAVVVVLLAVRLLRLDRARFSSDAVYYLAQALRGTDQPAALLEPDYIGRRHPLFLGMTALVERAFGPALAPFVVLTYAGHLAAVLLLGSLVVRLGTPPPVGACAAFAFAVFGGANNLFADPIHFARTWNLALALGALVALRAGRVWLYVGLYAASLANFEDALLLPVAALALERLVPERAPARGDGPGAAATTSLRTRTAAHGTALVLLATAAVLAATAPASARPLALGAHVATKAGLLPVEIARQALVFRADVLPPLAARLALALVTLGCLLPRPRDVRVSRRTALALLALATAFALPYLARPTVGAWPSRYLYFPAAPLLALAGATVAATPIRRRAVGLGLLAAIGVTTTERAADVIAERHLHAFTSASPAAVVELAARHLAPTTCPPPPPPWLTAADCAFLAASHLRTPIACDALVRSGRSDTLEGGGPR